MTYRAHIVRFFLIGVATIAYGSEASLPGGMAPTKKRDESVAVKNNGIKPVATDVIVARTITTPPGQLQLPSGMAATHPAAVPVGERITQQTLVLVNDTMKASTRCCETCMLASTGCCALGVLLFTGGRQCGRG